MLLEWMLHSLNAYLSHCTMHAIPALWNAFMLKISKVDIGGVFFWFFLYCFSWLIYASICCGERGNE